ncbi:MAG: hypothetical protein ACM3P0_00845 [Acidobacteriota bacterium]
MKSNFLRTGLNKMLKILFLFVLFFSVSFPQEYTKTYNAVNGSQVKKQLYPDGQSSFFSGIPYDYGTQNGTTSTATVISRSIYEVPFSFSSGDYITKVEIIYKNKLYQDGNFRLYNIPEKGTSPKYPDLWAMTEANGVTELATLGGNSYNTQTIYVYKLQEIVNNALAAGKTSIYVGFRAATEMQNVCASAFELLQLKFTYERRVRHTIRNSNSFGKIDVSINNGPYYQITSDTVLNEKIGTNIKLKAKEEQFDGTYFWVWNQDPNTLEATKSNWQKKYNDIYSLSNSIEYPYTANENEIYVTFTAQLKRKFLVSRIDKTEFDGSFQTNDLARVVEGNSVNIPYSETLTKTTGTYNFAGWESGGTASKTPADNTTYTALYKMPHKSSTQTTFSNSGQRKFIMTPQTGHPYGGDLHMVYESMGKIWYERSIDGGNTWILENGGKPLNTDYIYDKATGQTTGSGGYTTAKHPSLDYVGNMVAVVFQEQYGANYLIRLSLLAGGIKKGTANDILFTSPGLYSEEAYPEIALKNDFQAVVAIRRNDPDMRGLEVHYLMLNTYDGTTSENCHTWITGTDQNTGAFTLATDKSSTDKFHIAWQQGSEWNSSIQYARFNFSWTPGGAEVPGSSSLQESSALVDPGEPGTFEMNILNSSNLSSVTSCTAGYLPSMFAANDGTVRVAFKGYEGDNSGNGFYYIVLVNPYNTSWIPYLNKHSGPVYSPQISAGSETYFVGWTEPYGGVYETIATDASSLRILETVRNASGRDMQINTGGTRFQQFAMGFNSESSTLPYSFRRSDSLGTIIANKTLQISNGRGVYLTKDQRQIFFLLGNVNAGKTKVDLSPSEYTFS